MSYLVPISLLALLAIAAGTDLHRRQVPNWLVAAVALLWLTQLPQLAGAAVATALVAATGLLILGAFCWQRDWIGAGDAKLLAAVGLWAADHLIELLLATALAGGALALGQMLKARLTRAGCSAPARHDAAAARTGSVPYAVAIAVGGCWLVLGHGLAAGVS